MSTNVNQQTMMEALFRTLGADESKAWQNNYQGKLTRLLAVNGIEEFIYRNYVPDGDIRYFVTVLGKMTNGALVSSLHIQRDPSAPQRREDVTHYGGSGDYINLNPPKADTPVNIGNSKQYNNSAAFLSIRKQDGAWTLFDRNIDAGFITNNADNIRARSQPNTQEYRQIYHELDEAIRVEQKKQEQQPTVYYENAKKEVQARLSNPDYSDVRLGVTLRQQGNDRVEQMFSSGDGADLHLDITIGTNGSVDIKHSLSEDYLQQYVPQWEQEVSNRGLAGVVNVEELRQEVMDYFVSEELKQSMWQKFIQYVNATVGTKVGGYVEAIQATQKVTNNIWEEGTLPQDLWYYENSQSGGESWPEYMRMSPEIGGGVDGVIDEIVGLPLACKSVYQIATDKEKRDALKAVFTKEGAKQLLQGLKQEAIEIGNDDKKLRHFASQTTVSVAAIFLGTGLLSKAGKSDDLLNITEESLKKAEALSNPSLIKNIDIVKKSERKAIKEAEIKSFAETAGNDILSDIGGDFLKIYKKGESIDVLAKARNLPGISTGVGKEIKGTWLKGSERNAGLFPKSVADKLKEKNYKNFDKFREAFWQAVADDPELAKQFDNASINRMKKGYAPYTDVNQQIGGQKNYVLHHKIPINQGGEVYDMDNLYIVTPKFHKEILDPNYHYGYGY